MPITIPHRFIERLLPPPDMKVKILFVGTFNPGEPDPAMLSTLMKSELVEIFATKKYQQFNETQNFYDRPQNRFWGILDRIAHPEIYGRHGVKYRHTTGGLKHLRSMDRMTVYQRQKAFCAQHGLFTSDIVRKIEATNLSVIYNRFEDVHVDPVATEWNTLQLIKVVKANPEIKLLLNFKQSWRIPRISEQVELLKQAAGSSLLTVSSSSGAAGGKYERLVPEWQEALGLGI